MRNWSMGKWIIDGKKLSKIIFLIITNSPHINIFPSSIHINIVNNLVPPGLYENENKREMAAESDSAALMDLMLERARMM